MTGKILIVDDVATNRIVLRVKLASAYYDALQAASGAEALRIAAECRPDLILLDMQLPDVSGIEVCRWLKADPATRDIPVVMISAFQDSDRRIEALRAGAEDVYWKPLDELILMARIRSLLRACEAREQLGLRDGTYREFGFAEPSPDYFGPGLVGLVAARVETALRWKRELQPHLSDRLLVLDRDAALGEIAEGEAPDLFVVAADLGRPGDGLRFLSELRSRQATRHSRVCLVLPATARDVSATALDLGAGDLIDSAAEPEEMALRIRAQLRAKRQADRLRSNVADGLRLAMTDPLTGLHNRRYGLSHLQRIAEHARHGGRSFAALILDLDRFKTVNDTWGHAAGDAVLIEVARRLRDNLAAGDLLARIGGEEFLIALPDIGFRKAHAVAERIRRVIGDHPFRLPGGGQVAMTLSIGLAMGCSRPDGEETTAMLLDRADQALLAAKTEGRNQVTVNRTAA